MSDTTRDFFETLAGVLLRCWIFGLVLQIISSGGVLIMSDFVHHLHGHLFGLSIQQSGMIMAGYLTLIKLSVVVFFFIPWLAIWLVLNKNR